MKQVPQIATQAPARWYLRAPMRILDFILLLVAFAVSGQLAGRAIGIAPIDVKAVRADLAGTALHVLPFVLAYWVLVRFIERRRVSELAWRKLPHLLLGLLAALLLFGVVALELWGVGVYRITGFGDAPLWTLFLLFAVIPGVTEEIVCRGILFRLVEESLGTWIALAVSALFFGFAHFANPGATLWSSLAIMIEAGLLFGLLYHVTRSLWWCIGLHAGWNFVQGAVLGIPVSGVAVDGLAEARLSGPDWLDGGGFGAEASALTVLTCSIATLYLVHLMRRRGSRIAPFWKRAKRTDAQSAALQ